MKTFNVIVSERSVGDNATFDVEYDGDRFDVEVLDDEPVDVWGPIFQRLVETVAEEVGEDPSLWVVIDWRPIGLHSHRTGTEVGGAYVVFVGHS